jgi:hypothetical protein
MTKAYRWVCGLGLLLASVANAATQQDIDTARSKGLAYLVLAQQGVGNWLSGGGLGVQSTAAVLEALQNAGIGKGGTYSAGLSWLANAVPDSVDGLARRILALQAAGRNDSAGLGRLLGLKNAANRYTWGAYAGFETGFPDTALALAALRMSSGGAYPNQTQLLATTYCEILPAQNADGSWSYIKPAGTAPASGSRGAILPTAYTLIELVSVASATSGLSYSCGTPYNLASAITAGADWLLTKKNTDGGFGESGQSAPLETALIYLALQTARPSDTALPGARDYLLIGAGKPLANGSWANDSLQTALVLKTLPATVLTDTAGNGLPDAVKTALGLSPAVDAVRNALPGNGQAQSGLNVTVQLTGATQNVPYTLALAPQFSGPYHFMAGGLPDGLILNEAAGMISGTPTRAGTFNFSFSNLSGTTQAQIAVTAAAAPPIQVPALPVWAGLMLAGSLWHLSRRASRPRTL